MTGQRIALIAVHVFKECVRDRVLYSIVAFAALLVGASVLIGQITAGQDLKILKDLGLATIELAGLAIAIVIGVGLVSKEIERRSVHSLLAKPLPRWEFIAGKYAGLVATIVVNVGLMTVVFYAVLAWIAWTTPAEVQKGWEAAALDPAMLLAILLVLAELSLVTAFALFFSSFSSSGFLSVILTLGVWVAGVLSADLRGFEDVVASPMGTLVAGIGWIVPAFSAFDLKAAVVHGQPVPPAYVAMRLAYAAVYAGVAVGASILVFSRREFR